MEHENLEVEEKQKEIIDEIVIEKISLHFLDVENNNIDTIDVNKHIVNIVQYVKNLINADILKNPNKRKYSFKEGETQVKSSIAKLIKLDLDIDKILLNNAKRLLEKEISAEKKVAHLGKQVQRGSLLHVYFKQNGNNRILICKVEHDEILNESTFDFSRGLNTKKKVFKAFLHYPKNDISEEEIYLNDKNNSNYWWNEFLEMNQLNSDENNTERTFEKIITIVDRNKRKEENLLDGTILRNSIIHYFRNNENFDLADFIDSIENFKPFNKDYPFDKILGYIKDLEKDESIDNQFIIIPSRVKKNLISKIRLGNGLYLNIDNTSAPNFKNILKPYNEGGAVGMTIISEEAYRFIKQIKNDN